MEKKIIAKLREKYFDNKNVLELKKGEILMVKGQENRRLFLVLEGSLAGLVSEDKEKIEVFRSGEDMLVGLHSFFSRTFFAYSEVVALEDSKLSYIAYEDDKVRPDEFLEDFLPVIIDALFERQLFAKKLMMKQEEALKRNLHRDKLATLGQMAEGIAHELNNAIGVIRGNEEWLEKEIFNYIKDKESPEVFSNFEKGYDNGQNLSSAEVRKNKQFIEKKLKLSTSYAKKLAQLGFGKEEIKSKNFKNPTDEVIDNMHHFWKMGVAIHDIILASEHAADVINSVKLLGSSEREQTDVNVNRTLDEALVLVQKQTEGIKVSLEKEDNLPLIKANDTELKQVWINLIKNACESLKASETENPEVKVTSEKKKDEIWISINDNGPGIPNELKEKIFRPNFTTKKGGLSFGLGIGLSVVQKYVDQYKGTIDVKSKPGKTTFYIKLPITQS
ncbi:MAG: hypothetical protein CSA05_02745 [Bacteroidia bacterium]|nr:MAG: hypothetical protein CSA05_02745 [Bacteroidia bacterium]